MEITSETQEFILKKFMSAHNQPTLKDIATITNIGIGRIFQIFNGSEMLSHEIQVFDMAARQ